MIVLLLSLLLIAEATLPAVPHLHRPRDALHQRSTLCKKSTGKQKVIMSALSAGTDTAEPIGFKWIRVLAEKFASPQKEYHLLLHGACLYYGLNDNAYRRKFNTNNPQLAYLTNLHNMGVQIRICELCLQDEGFSNADLLPFVQVSRPSPQVAILNNVFCSHLGFNKLSPWPFPLTTLSKNRWRTVQLSFTIVLSQELRRPLTRLPFQE
jgi:intracellular sulfur oxidation DsrE/DsrF family protein